MMINIAPFRRSFIRFHLVPRLAGGPLKTTWRRLNSFSYSHASCLCSLMAQFAEPDDNRKSRWRLLLRKLPTLTQWIREGVSTASSDQVQEEESGLTAVALPVQLFTIKVFTSVGIAPLLLPVRSNGSCLRPGVHKSILKLVFRW